MDHPRDIGIFLPFSDPRQELQVDESNPSVCLFSEEADDLGILKLVSMDGLSQGQQEKIRFHGKIYSYSDVSIFPLNILNQSIDCWKLLEAVGSSVSSMVPWGIDDHPQELKAAYRVCDKTEAWDEARTLTPDPRTSKRDKNMSLLGGEPSST